MPKAIVCQIKFDLLVQNKNLGFLNNLDCEKQIDFRGLSSLFQANSRKYQFTCTKEINDIRECRTNLHQNLSYF